MTYKETAHRDADILFKHKYKSDYDEVIDVIKNITEKDLMDKYNALKKTSPSMKSLSTAINTLIKERLVKKKWIDEPYIFTDPDYKPSGKKGSAWRLDFTKNDVCIEVAFNHSGSVAHNMIKPVLSSNLNHVAKYNQTNIGIIITATSSLRKSGNFDNAIGTYEHYIQYLKPYSNIITCPLLIIGLEAPKTFFINPSSKTIKMHST